jgi:Anti-sigma-K factor rskA
MSGPDTQRERLAELVIVRALHGSTPEQDAEMRQLSGALGVWDDGSFERAASAVLVAGLPAVLEPMPAHLYARVAESAASAGPEPASSVRRAPARSTSSSAMALRTGLAVSGWLAAAAFLVIAVWALRGHAPEPVAVVPPTISAEPPAQSPAAKEREPTSAERRAALLASAKDVVRVDWKPGKDATGASASGDVVWSATEQRGYMRLSGLEANDPNVSQYQLWIFDKGRDAKFPVDGGVFDVRAGGEVVVPIEAKLHVDAPTLFAVTVERPGGVVVSDRKRIAILASTG